VEEPRRIPWRMEKTTNTRFKVDKFNGKNNFELWKLEIWDFLVQQELHKSLEEKRKKLVDMLDYEWENVDARGLNTIRFCLVDEVLFIIVGEETTSSLWRKMEILYMRKSLTNRIYLKRKLYSIWMK
jgi:hypothetical protein